MVFLQNRKATVIGKTHQIRWLANCFRLAAITLGGLHTWAAIVSHSMNADGISYLDIGDAYMLGDWAAAINGVWSPMYSWILGLVLHVVKPSMRWEFPVVHMVNFAVYLAALICFEFFWRQVINYNKSRLADESNNSLITLPEWALMSLGYIIFIVSSLQLIQIWSVTPDMLMAGFVYLISGLILRIRMGSRNFVTFSLFGMLLGLAYLDKAVMFPLGFIFIGVSLFSAGNLRRAIPRVSAALTIFLLFSLPFIALVSHTKGKLNFGDAGKLTYAKYVNGLEYPHWQGDSSGNGTPEHPSRKIFDKPAIYEFGTPVAGTYPISHDPSYWYEGLVVRYTLKNQLQYLMTSALFYFDLFFRQQAGLLFGVLLLYLMCRWQRFATIDIISRWGLLIPALAAFGLYGMINVTGRYVGVFVVLFWADLLANVRIPSSQTSKRLASLLSIAMILFMSLNILFFNLKGYRDLTGNEMPKKLAGKQAKSPSWPGEVAAELHRLGIERDDTVAVIGYGFSSFWARLAPVKIVAEMFNWEADPLWLGTPSFQSQVIQAFRKTGARAIVAESVPNYARLAGWHQINNTNYYIYLLSS